MTGEGAFVTQGQNEIIAAHMEAIRAASRRVEDLLLPVRLLRSGEQDGLRRYLNSAHLERARALGISPQRNAEGVAALGRSGRLVRLPDTTAYWVIRRLDHSLPFVTPATRDLLEAVGRRFQAVLHEEGLPAFRIEITSALRTGEDQARLRGSNENAALGRSTHEYGTTVDIAYDGFAAPAEPVVSPPADLPRWLDDHLREAESLALERVAARKSRELQAYLGRLLAEMQAEGQVLVTLEELQPVFHITVASNR